ncbi:MAG TPA: DedA family protein [Gammaproteobacteria bacterium]|nr:DedA family protein [Gammaproteobacteria bacterium]
MEITQSILQLALHIDDYLIAFVATYGTLTYVLLFLIIFCETGLVITPFLPGDSLIFAAGSIAANSYDHLNIQLLFLVLVIASILGNKINYLIGRFIGPRVFTTQQSWLFNKNHLEEAHRFYEKYGGKALIFARFIPIIRTFAPFVAGIGYMSIRLFTFYNIISALLWISSLLGVGYYLGSHPFVKAHFTTVIYCIITISLLPPLFSLSYQKVTRWLEK